jgi:hypothetical protein
MFRLFITSLGLLLLCNGTSRAQFFSNNTNRKAVTREHDLSLNYTWISFNLERPSAASGNLSKRYSPYQKEALNMFNKNGMAIEAGMALHFYALDLGMPRTRPGLGIVTGYRTYSNDHNMHFWSVRVGPQLTTQLFNAIRASAYVRLGLEYGWGTGIHENRNIQFLDEQGDYWHGSDEISLKFNGIGLSREIGFELLLAYVQLGCSYSWINTRTNKSESSYSYAYRSYNNMLAPQQQQTPIAESVRFNSFNFKLGFFMRNMFD